MAADRDRERQVFECPVVIKRAIRARAGIEGVKPADVIVAALRAYLKDEIEQATRRMAEEDKVSKPAKKP
jgi:hypothetical protein